MPKFNKLVAAAVVCLLILAGSLAIPLTARAAFPRVTPTSSPITDAQIQEYAVDSCTNSNGVDKSKTDDTTYQKALAACELGYTDGFKQNPSKDDACNDLSDGSITGDLYKKVCQSAYDKGASIGPRLSDTATSSQIQGFANDACSDYNGDAATACHGGFKAGFGGTVSKTDECNHYLGVGHTIQNACLAGYDLGSTKGNSVDATKLENPTGTSATQAATGAGSPSTPTCESSGFSLSWILCPIIEGTAKAADGIYSNFVQPLLRTDPINLSDPSHDPTHLYDIWSNFRVYGDIFLVIALLVVVFGESIGGGLIDAYAAKKILPRLLIAAVAINLSIYLVALAVDLTNIIGNGVAALIETPFRSAEAANGAYTIHIGGATGDIGMAALVGGGIWAVAAAGPLIEFLLLMTVIPAFLTLIAIMVTVIVRRGLIILLILFSPVAFALYCLPNTEQYFRRWWDLLLRTLLVYPLIAIFFAIGNVLSVTINSTASGISGSFTALLSVFTLFVPLFLIPFSFRIAGGLLGRLHDLATNARKRSSEAIKGNVNDPNSWRNMTRRKLANRTLAQREGFVSKGINLQTNNRSALGKALGGGLANVAGFGNYQQRRSVKNKEASDYVQAQVATGNDSSVRAMFSRQLKYRDDNGNDQNGWFGIGAKVGNDGYVVGATKPQFSEFEVGKARSLMAHDASFYQAGLTYEIGKAGDDQELDTLRSVNADNINSSPWLRQESVGIVKGAGFSHVQSRREMKHEDLNVGAREYTRSSVPFTREVAENVSNWGLSNMRTSTVRALQDDYRAAQAYLTVQPNSGATAAQRQEAERVRAELKTHKVQSKIESTDDARAIIGHVEATAKSLDTRRQLTGGFALAGEGDNQSPVSGSQTGAPGHVNEEIENLIQLAGPSPGPSGGGSTGGGQSGVITPGSPGFNVPPGSRPGGPNFQ